MATFLAFLSTGWTPLGRHRRKSRQFKIPDVCFDEIDQDYLESKTEECELLDERLAEPVPELAAVAGRIVGACVLRYHHAYTGPLTSNSLQWRCMSHYLGNDLTQILFLEVLDTLEIAEPPNLIHKGGRGADQSAREVVAAMTQESLEELLQHPAVHAKIVEWLNT